MEIAIGDSVKIRIMGNGHMERIWATVKEVNTKEETLKVVLDNHPVNPAFKYGEELEVPTSYVFEKYDPPPTSEKGE